MKTKINTCVRLKKVKFNITIVLTAALLLCGTAFSAHGQRQKPFNLETFTYRPYHFGFILGFNGMNFRIKQDAPYMINDSLFTITARPEYGFQIGIIANKRLSQFLDLKLSTVLAFGERKIDYTIRYNNDIVTFTKPVESTFLEFPLSLKYRSKRINNFGAYVLNGIKYGIDLASQSEKIEETDNYIVKLKKHEFAYEIGVGFDFYLPYFKFGIELKTSFGVNDLLVRDKTIFTDGFGKLTSKIWQLSFTFEG